MLMKSKPGVHKWMAASIFAALVLSTISGNIYKQTLVKPMLSL